MMDRAWRAEYAEITAESARRRRTPPRADPRALQPRGARSACPSAAADPRLENIPVVSWLAVGGKCAGCKGISKRYPIVELLTGLMSRRLPGSSVSVAGGRRAHLHWFLVLTFIDLDTQFCRTA